MYRSARTAGTNASRTRLGDVIAKLRCGARYWRSAINKPLIKIQLASTDKGIKQRLGSTRKKEEA